MPKFVQVQKSDGTYELIQSDGVRRAPPPRVFIIGPQKSFRSPVTGEEIHSRVQLRQHMKEHDIVYQGDYGPNNGADYFARRAEERAKVFLGTDEKEKAARKRDIAQAIAQLESGDTR